MGKLYNFTRLINKYKCDYTLLYHAEGKYEGGLYKDGETITEIKTGAIVPISSKKIYQSGGTYSAKDKQLYSLTRIPKALLGAKVLYQGNTYSIEEDADYSEFADVFIYVLRKDGTDD